jgi:hypothetical protein
MIDTTGSAARRHGSGRRRTVELQGNETPDFIPPTLWPPNSPDLNPVDYKIRSVMQERVYRTKVCDIEDLRQRIMQVWDEFDQSIIDASVKQWRRRLHACNGVGVSM